MTETTYTATAAGEFTGSDISCRCALGRGGVIDASQKREGDGASPIGIWQMKRAFYRPDRLPRPETALPVIALKETDGWCDAATHPLYNRPVTLPFSSSHEKLWRDDHVYDVIVELSHNSDPIVPNLGSAVFFHLAREDFRPTEGCVAVSLEQMLKVLKTSSDKTSIKISR